MYYQHSGKAPIGGTALAVLSGCLISVALGVLYGACTWPLPIYYRWISSCWFFMFCFVLNVFLNYLLLYLAKCRNSDVIMGSLLLGQLIAYLTSWVVWLHHYGSPGQSLWSQILTLNQTGVWSLRFVWASGTGTIVNGPLLAFAWFMEAFLVLGSALAGAQGLRANEVFCERCDDWCPKQTTLFYPPQAPDSLRQALENKNLSILGQPAAEKPEAGDWLEATPCLCAKCGQLATLSVDYAKRGSGDTVDRSNLLRNLLISPADLKALTQAPSPPPV